ncbi:hypothetical protein ATCC90586_003780 [Pythium insidiosum]|nr:hypothetical protein ATCC90586_003780 [Pythium insidiosum]
MQRLRALADSALTIKLKSSKSTSSTSEDVLEPTVSPAIAIVLRLLESFTGFTIFVFLAEVIFLAVVFRRRFALHLGYVLDTLIISASILAELYAGSSGTFILKGIMSLLLI